MFTQTDIDKVEAAIVKLAAGERVVTVNYAGPPARSVTYQAADLAQLRALLAEMRSSSATATRRRLAATRKGL